MTTSRYASHFIIISSALVTTVVFRVINLSYDFFFTYWSGITFPARAIFLLLDTFFVTCNLVLFFGLAALVGRSMKIGTKLAIFCGFISALINFRIILSPFMSGWDMKLIGLALF